MKISILTICPEQFNSFLETPLIARSTADGLLSIKIVDIRDYAKGCFRKVDDSPYGGGAGMILRCEPVLKALAAVRGEPRLSVEKNDDFPLSAANKYDSCEPAVTSETNDTDPLISSSHVVILSPIGKPYSQKIAHRLSEADHLILICGHFEGLDARIYPHADEILSIGDYILTGGELPAMVISDSVTRLITGTMKAESIREESFENGMLEYPQYTRPAVYRGQKVPEILLSGNHKEIKKWRAEESYRITRKYRPDLLSSPEHNARPDLLSSPEHNARPDLLSSPEHNARPDLLSSPEHNARPDEP